MPVGVTAVEGNVVHGDIIALADPGGGEFARGLVNYDARDAREVAGRRSDELSDRLGSLPYSEVVHRDNLVILEDAAGN